METENAKKKYTQENLKQDLASLEDNLNALLADLQTNLSKPQQHTATTVISTTTYPISQTETLKSPQNSHHEQHKNIYQNEDYRVNNISQQQTLQNGYTNHNSVKDDIKSPSSPEQNHIYQNEPPNAQKMYRHETREEVRTETRSSGPNPSPATRPTTNNLSELDSLLHDLNTSKNSGILKDRGAVNGARPSVDSLLDELNSVGHTATIESRTSSIHKDSRFNQTPPAPPPASYGRKTTTSTVSASNATKELDDLMESLSDFKGLSHIEGKNLVRTDYANKKEVDKNTTISTKVTRIEEAPPRPPAPADNDILAVPPPRPPVPSEYVVLEGTDEISLPATLPRPPSPSAPLPTQSIIYRQLNQNESPQHTLRVREGVVYTSGTNVCGSLQSANNRYGSNSYDHTDVALDDPVPRPSSGGPVKRNDAEYRWVTDQIKHEVREVIEVPVIVEEKKKQEKLRSPAMVRKLLTQVDTAYAKPLPKRKSPSPPPAPKPSPPNQLDCMLGTLTSHMTEQGINTSQKGCCCACDKPIVGQVITALGKTWHPEHFTCTHCQQELGTKNFFEREGKPYCETDYHNLFSPKCAYCSGPILDKCVTALNKTWHPEHFFCAQCGNTFGDEGFHEKNGKPYCKEDYFNMFAPKCGGCNNPIMENYISALNSQWHPECFVCRDCHQPFNGGSFFDHEGLPYCETHYHAKRGSLCAGCNKPITGRCITAMFRKYHPEHFVCAFCLQQLNKGTFKEQNDKPYCHPCFDKLYG